MAYQVKPFEVPICLGYMVYCAGDDFLEPEGVVYFNEPPVKGNVAILSDGKQWEVTTEPNDQMEIVMKQTDEPTI